MPTRYRAAAPGTIAYVALDAFTALYHRPSGVTHLLAEPAPEILAALADAPLDTDALIAALSARYDLRAVDRDVLAERLAELVAAGLVATA